MDGKQQAPPQAQDAKKAPCMCGENDLQEPNGCAECRCQNRPYVVQVSILQELPPNKFKRNEKAKIIGIVIVLVLYCTWEALAIYGAWQIENENVYLSAFYTIVNWAFIAVAGWYFCEAILGKFDIMD